MSCYKSHLVVLKESKPISRDNDLQQLIDTYVIAVFWDVVVLLLQQVPLKYKKPLKVLGLSAAVK